MTEGQVTHAVRQPEQALRDSDPPPSGSTEPARAQEAAPARSRTRAVLHRILEDRGWTVTRVVTHTVALYLAVIAAVVGAPPSAAVGGGAVVWALPPITLALLWLRGAYRRTLEHRLLDRMAHAVSAVSLAAMALIAVRAVTESGATAGLVVRAWVFGILYLGCAMAILELTRRRAQANRFIGSSTLIVGAGRVGAHVERRLSAHPEFGLVPVGFLDADPAPAELVPGRRAPVLGAPPELGRVAVETGARHVVLAFMSAPDTLLVPLVRECERLGLAITVVPRLFESVNRRMQLEHMGGLPLYGLRSVNPRGWEFAVKHFLGRAVAVVALVLLSPLMLALALAVRLTSPGPVIFRQRRIGRDGHEFELLKFRSMRVPEPEEAGTSPVAAREVPLREVSDDTGPGGAEGDLRTTPIGGFIRSFSLDELPQLWNVARGDMTLVGPRPERPEFVELFGRSVSRYDDRHRVKSGITGWAQVHGLRGRTSLADRVEWDNYYIENWSLWLDFKIMLMTLTALFRPAE